MCTVFSLHLRNVNKRQLSALVTVLFTKDKTCRQGIILNLFQIHCQKCCDIVQKIFFFTFLFLFSEEIESIHLKHAKEISTESGVSATHTHSHSEAMEPHSVIGVALVLGFIFMLLIDQISSGHGRMQAQGTIILQMFVL